ncbi:MAG: GNAT family protein [Desulfobacterales bacterium]|jgi:RimJ/RimL family protein N-acetyltransferase
METPLEFSIKTGDVVIIKSPTENNAQAVYEYFNKIGGETDYLTFGEGEYDSSISDFKKMFKELDHRPNSLILIAVVETKVIAVLNFTGGNRTRTRHVGNLGITVSKRFWECGIGSKMLRELLSWARKTDPIRKINLKVRTDNVRAIRFYKKFGFKEEGRISRDSNIGGQFYDNLCMGLKIDK